MHLRIFPCQKLLGRQFKGHTWGYSFTFDEPPLPCEICSHRQAEDITRLHTEGRSAQQSARCFLANDSCKPILFCERGNHFAGAGRMLVHEDDHSPVEFLRPQPLSDDKNRLVDESVAQCEPEESGLVRWYTAKSWQLFSGISLFFSCSR